MKQGWLILYLLLLGPALSAQTWNEWFQQDATASKYNRQQLAALKVQVELVAKGYAIVNQGLDAIQAIKKNNLLLHTTHFHSFTLLSPVLKAWPGMQKILLYHKKIMQGIEKAQRMIAAAAEFPAGEKLYLQKVMDRLRQEAINQQASFYELVNPGNLTLTDDERFLRIVRLFQNLQQDAAFLQSFTHETGLLLLQRRMETTQTRQLKKNLGL